MVIFPDTSASLVLRIADARDVRAWEEFSRLYQPVVYRLARQRGLQHADAEELVQEVMLAVARAVEKWVPDPARGRFRDWLFRMARNLVINFLTRRKYQSWGTGDSDVARLLEAQPDSNAEWTRSFELEYRRELLRRAAERVQGDFHEKTWHAFELSAIKEVSPAEVADRLGMSLGSVYIARSRVMARLRDEVSQIEGRDVT